MTTSISTPDPVDVAVGARIRLLRKLKRLSQETLGEAVGVTFQQIQKYERGANRVSASMLVRIAAALGVPAAELLGDAAPKATGAVDEVAVLLAEPGALSVLKSYAALPKSAGRGALVEFLRSLSAAPA